MSRVCFKPKKFSSGSCEIIDHANSIIREWAQQGYNLTLRQLYYQFVSQDLITNTERSYNRIGSIISDAREAGMVDWDAITDRTRVSRAIGVDDSPKSFLERTVKNYSQNHWADQDVYIEVWVEKEALSQIVGQAANAFYAPYLACKGYVSASAMYESAKRFMEASIGGKECHLIYLGDHDPSGIDMSRDITDRLDRFTSQNPHCHCITNNLEESGEHDNGFMCEECQDWMWEHEPGWLTQHRVALNMDQIHEYGPPPNPAKITDSRAAGYIKKFGSSSWELDALEPSVINELITDKIEDLIDVDAYEAAMEKEKQYVEQMKQFAEKFSKSGAE